MEAQEAAPAPRLNGSDKAQDVRAKIHEGTEALFSEMKGGHSDRALQYFAFMSKFHRYTFNNQMSIFMQLHTASRVNSFKRWKELGYTVAKGQKALYILAPRIYKKINEKTQLEETRTYFTAVPVFDVSQLAEIEEKPFPEFFTPLADDQKALVRRVEDVIRAAGIRLGGSLNLDGSHGRSSHGQINVRYGLDSRRRFLALIHGFAHQLLHWDEIGKVLPSSVKEHRAEAIGYIVAHRYGIHNPSSADYLRTWNADLDDLRKELSVIQKTSHRIIELIDATADEAALQPEEAQVMEEQGTFQEPYDVDTPVEATKGTSPEDDDAESLRIFDVWPPSAEFFENYEDTGVRGLSSSEINAGVRGNAFDRLKKWYLDIRPEREENLAPRPTVEAHMDAPSGTSTETERAFLLQQMDRSPLNPIEKRKHIAWCRRECRRLGMTVPGWFNVVHGHADDEEPIIVDYYPSRAEANPPSARQSPPAITHLLQDDEEDDAGNEEEDVNAGDEDDEEEVADEDGDEDAGVEEDDDEEDDDDPLTRTWEDGDASETSPWLTVDEGILIGRDGVLVAGFVPTPQVSWGTAHTPIADTADEFTVDAAFAEVRALQARATALLDGDDASANPSVVLAAIREARQCIVLAARLAGILHGD